MANTKTVRKTVTKRAGAKKSTSSKKTLSQSANYMTPDGKSMVIYLILAWFLGAFGVHKFYVGNRRTGTIMLILGLVGLILIVPLFVTAIWSLIDFVVGLFNFNHPDKILSGK